MPVTPGKSSKSSKLDRLSWDYRLTNGQAIHVYLDIATGDSREAHVDLSRKKKARDNTAATICVERLKGLPECGQEMTVDEQWPSPTTGVLGLMVTLR